MRTEFLKVLTRKQAEDRAPWAAEIVEAESGFWAFERADDTALWLGMHVDVPALDSPLPAPFPDKFHPPTVTQDPVPMAATNLYSEMGRALEDKIPNRPWWKIWRRAELKTQYGV